MPAKLQSAQRLQDREKAGLILRTGLPTSFFPNGIASNKTAAANNGAFMLSTTH
jgi:hypothetical protein